jgi:glucose/arabinose dehydrogenase
MQYLPTIRLRPLVPALLVAIAFVPWASPVLAEVIAPALARPEDQARFRVSVFATGLGYPTSMAQLADGSLLVATSDGGASWLSKYIFASTSGALVRLADTNGDGIADGPPQTVATGLPGLVTSVRREGNLVFALSSQGGNQAITVWRTGSSAASPLQAAGRLSFSFSSSFEHTTYALATRPAPDGGVEVFFNIGAESNSQSTPVEKTVGLTATAGAAFASGTAFQLAADSVHRITVTDDSSTLTIGQPQQIARGLRNAAGLIFDPQGNLWLQDNGIDDRVSGVSISADELNRIAAADVSVAIPNFGFAETYIDYATGAVVGPTAGVELPLVAFRPLAGERSEGAVELALAPTSFPSDFSGGVFVPFSGVFNQGGINNPENPLVFVNTANNTYFHFIENQKFGHPNGLLATSDALYVSDLNYLGLFGNPAGSTPLVPADQQGVIYRITYVPEPSSIALAIVGFSCFISRFRRPARRSLFGFPVLRPFCWSKAKTLRVRIKVAEPRGLISIPRGDNF